MQTLLIDLKTPLAHCDFSLRVWVVVGVEDGIVSGVYASPERALQYCQDWVTESGEGQVVTIEGDYLLIDGIPHYSLQESQFQP